MERQKIGLKDTPRQEGQKKDLKVTEKEAAPKDLRKAIGRKGKEMEVVTRGRVSSAAIWTIRRRSAVYTWLWRRGLKRRSRWRGRKRMDGDGSGGGFETLGERKNADDAGSLDAEGGRIKK